jgi:hypothetical protein
MTASGDIGAAASFLVMGAWAKQRAEGGSGGRGLDARITIFGVW